MPWKLSTCGCGLAVVVTATVESRVLAFKPAKVRFLYLLLDFVYYTKAVQAPYALQSIPHIILRRQFNTIPGLMEGHAKPDYGTCVKISTDASLKEMIPPSCLVMLTPLIVGTLFGVETLSGVLAGALVSGVQVAISSSNTGGAWDNAKKYIETGASEHARTLGPKGSDPHKAAIIADTIGDPLKDTSGPSLSILIKLMAVESLVFAPSVGCCLKFRI